MQIVVGLAFLGVFVSLVVGAWWWLITRFMPNSAKLSARGARRFAKSLPLGAGVPTHRGFGWSPPHTRRALAAYAAAGFVLFPVWLAFPLRHRHRDLIGTPDEFWLLRQRFMGRYEVIASVSRNDLIVEDRRRTSSAVVNVAGERLWLYPGHLDALGAFGSSA